ncbi:MAG TPA: hypothetical protein VG167_13970 [Verrucomicrobiae bacterium]|nr:hypothetical protein [Verrucomicrobiae bacterium]
MNDDAIKRTTKLILFQAQQDHAKELVISNSPGTGAAVRYKVADNWHDWKSPSHELAATIYWRNREIGQVHQTTISEGRLDRRAVFGRSPFMGRENGQRRWRLRSLAHRMLDHDTMHTAARYLLIVNKDRRVVMASGPKTCGGDLAMSSG